MKNEAAAMIGEDLDEAVALALGWRKFGGGHWWEPGTVEKDGGLMQPDGASSQCVRHVDGYSRDWAHGGPIIERECIVLQPLHNGLWEAAMPVESWPHKIDWLTTPRISGPTPLVAAMRCFVTAKLGYEVDL